MFSFYRSLFSYSFFLFSFCLQAQNLVSNYKASVKATPYIRLTKNNDDNVFVSGYFDNLNGEYKGRLLKLDGNGKMSDNFKNVYLNGAITFTRIQKDGKILISGAFSNVNGADTRNMIRLNADGSIDNSFKSAKDKVVKFAIQSDGKIVVMMAYEIARLNSDGSLDSSFKSLSLSGLGELVIGPSNEIYYSAFSIVYKLKSDGSVDNSFIIGSGMDRNGSYVSALTIQSDGKILIGGFFNSYNDFASKSLVRLNTDGTVDEQFKVGTIDGQIFSIIERANKNIIIAGQFSQFNNQNASVVELKPTGATHKILAVVYINSITSILETSAQNIIIGGEFKQVNGLKRYAISQFNSDYTISNAFNPEVSYNNPNSRLLEVMENGSAFVGGDHEFEGVYSEKKIIEGKLVKLNALGIYNSSFKPVQSDITALLVQKDNKITYSSFAQNTNDATIKRLNQDGSIDNTFAVGRGPTLNSSPMVVNCIKQKNDVLFIGGNMSAFNGTPCQSLIALNLDGSIKKTYPSLPANSYVYDMAFQTDGKTILIGGFSFDNSVSKSIIRLNEDGSVDNAFDFNLAGGVTSIQIDASNRIYLAGDLYSFNGALVDDLIRLLPNGSLDPSFNIGDGFAGNIDYLQSLCILPNGTIAAGGYFDTFQGHLSPGFALINENGDWIPTPQVNLGLSSIARQIKYNNGALYLAGSFFNTDYTSVSAIARINLGLVEKPLSPETLKVTLKSPGVSSIQWNKKSSNELGFILERAIDTKLSFVPIDTLESDVSSIQDSGIAPLKKYFYRIVAVNDAGRSGYSNIDSLTWIPAPQGVLDLTLNSIDVMKNQLTWQGTLTYHAGYIIERAFTSDVNFVALDTVSVNVNQFTDIVTNDGIYFYRVVAYNGSGKIYSNKVSKVVTALNESHREANIVPYPIPAKDVLNVKVTNMPITGRWNLISMSGQVIPLEPEFLNEEVSLNLVGVPQGIYIVQYVTPTGLTWRSKVIKE